MADDDVDAPPQVRAPGLWWRRSWRRLELSPDLAVAVLLVVAAWIGFRTLPDGGPARIALAAPVLLVIPGYLAVEASLARPWSLGTAGSHALFGLGLTPAVLGLLALATAVAPGAFRPLVLVSTVCAACVLLALVALVRRPAGVDLSSSPVPTPA